MNIFLRSVSRERTTSLDYVSDLKMKRLREKSLKVAGEAQGERQTMGLFLFFIFFLRV